MNTKRIPIEVRFWRLVRKTKKCWIWTGHRANGYGKIASGGDLGKPLRAHRVSWEIHHGAIPDQMKVLHNCDNRRCVRPSHLYLGTQGRNLSDALRRGRLSQAKLSVADVRGIRKSFIKFKDALSKRYKISKSEVESILRRDKWIYFLERRRG